jgi:hypothetical protein
VPRRICVPSRSAALAPPRDSIRNHVRLEGDRLVRVTGHFKGRLVRGSRFMATIGDVRFQFETSKVVGLLKDGAMSMQPNRRNRAGKNGPRRAPERRAADQRLFGVMQKKPTCGVRALAQELGVSHSVLSRRIMRLKERGLVARGESGWEVWTQPKCAAWVAPISEYGKRVESFAGDGVRYG